MTDIKIFSTIINEDSDDFSGVSVGLQTNQERLIDGRSSRLVMMRHFSAQNSQFGVHDRDRSLIVEKSQEEFGIVKKNCSVELEKISFVLCSNTKRTRQTLEEISPLLPSHVDIDIVDSLYCATMDQILDHIRSVDLVHQNVLIIGHNPGLGCFLQEVQKENCNPYYAYLKSFPVGGMAVFESISESWIKLNFQALKLREMFYEGLKNP